MSHQDYKERKDVVLAFLTMCKRPAVKELLRALRVFVVSNRLGFCEIEKLEIKHKDTKDTKRVFEAI
jgi:hypothetical protein